MPRTKFYKIVLFARQLNPQFSSCQLRYMIFRRDVECVQKILNSKCRKRFKSPRKIQKYSLHNSSTGDRSLNSIYLKSHPNVFLPFCNYSVRVFTFSTNLWKYRKVFFSIFGFQWIVSFLSSKSSLCKSCWLICFPNLLWLSTFIADILAQEGNFFKVQ